MASFFGEVIPVVSRAVDEDDDEDNEDEKLTLIPSPACVRWSAKIRQYLEASSTNKLNCDVLIIAIGSAATSFTETYILQEKHELLGNICTGLNDKDENTFSQKAFTDKSCFIYQLKKKENVIVCQCKTAVAPEQAFSWTDLFLCRLDLRSAYVAVLASDTASNFQSAAPVGDLSTPFVRALKTLWFRGTPFCPYLESPNCIAGLPAQILTYCQIHKVATVLYVVYSDSIFMDASTVKAFMPIANMTPIKDIKVENPKSEELLANLIEQHQSKTALYI